MRKFARLCLTGVAIACSAMLLSGCAKPDPVVTPAPASSSKPLFASDEDALAAATKAYAAYLKMSDQIAQEGGVNPERLSSLVTPEWLKHETAASKKLAESKRHQTGETKFDGVRLQGYSSDEGGLARVGMYVCLDLSGERLLDETGADVTAEGVQARFPFVASFVGVSRIDSSLLLEGNEPWDGKNFC